MATTTWDPFYGVAENGRQLRVTINATPDIASNTSTVRAILELISVNGTPTFSSNTQIQTVINGVQTAWWEGSASYGAGTFLLADSYRVISHNANGDANATVIGSLVHGTGSLVVQVNTLTLPNIPRGTTPAISGGGGFTTGAASLISLPRADSGYTHDVTYKFGTKSGTIATGAGVTASWTPPHTLLTEIPDAVSGTVEITVVTKSGATVIGTKKVGFTLTAGASVVPTVSGVTWDDANTVVKALIGAFVQGQSMVHGTVAAAGVQGSTIASKRLTIAGAAVTESQMWEPATSGLITASGQATDSRGRTGSASANFNVLAYANPTLTTATVRRATSALGVVGEGPYLRMDLTAAVQSLVSGTEKNALKLLVRTRPTGGAWTTRNNMTHTALSYSSAIVMVDGGAAFSIAASFDVEITITDNLGRVATATRAVGTGGASFDIAAEGTGHGKIWEQGSVDAAGNIYQAGQKVVDQSQLASATVRGIVELATAAEINTGTDTTRAITPEALANAPGIPRKVASGRLNVPAGGTLISPFYYSPILAVVFPAGRFDVPPNVVPGFAGTGIGFANVQGNGLEPTTTTGFSVVAARLNAAFGTGTLGTQVTWHAKQMTPTSASG